VPAFEVEKKLTLTTSNDAHLGKVWEDITDTTAAVAAARVERRVLATSTAGVAGARVERRVLATTTTTMTATMEVAVPLVAFGTCATEPDPRAARRELVTSTVDTCVSIPSHAHLPVLLLRRVRRDLRRTATAPKRKLVEGLVEAIATVDANAARFLLQLPALPGDAFLVPRVVPKVADFHRRGLLLNQWSNALAIASALRLFLLPLLRPVLLRRVLRPQSAVNLSLFAHLLDHLRVERKEPVVVVDRFASEFV